MWPRTVPQRLAVGLAAALVLVVLAAAVAYRNLDRLTETSRDAELTNAMLDALGRTFSAVQDAETGERGFLLTRDDRYLEPYFDALTVLTRQMRELYRLADARPEYAAEISRYTAALNAMLDSLEQTLAIAHAAGFEAARDLVATGEGKARMDEVRRIVLELDRTAVDRLARERTAAEASARRAVFTIGLATALNFVLLVGLFVLIRRHMRDRARAEASIRALNRDLAAHARDLALLNKELETFSYSASHDLRAPLRGIDGFSRILEEESGDRLDEGGRDALARIRRACGQMTRLIDSLLTLSRLSRREIRRARVDLSALARGVAAALEPETRGRTVRFTIQPGLVVDGDPELLRAVVANLLGNAVKFTAGRAEAAIDVGATRLHDGTAAYFVRDNGMGFEMAYVDKLFRPFERLTADVEGTGIGLATVQRVVHRHGGRVWADGAPDRGAAFYFTLGADGHASAQP